MNSLAFLASILGLAVVLAGAPTVAQEKSDSQSVPAAQAVPAEPDPFAILSGKWNGEGGRFGYMINITMEIENIGEDGRIFGKVFVNGRESKPKVWKAARVVDKIEIEWESSEGSRFIGRVMGQDQIFGSFSGQRARSQNLTLIRQK